jgi:hypothetical protein
MSRSGVLIAILVAIALAAASLILLRSPPRAPGPTGPLLAFDPALVREIRFQRPGRAPESAQRLAPGEWVIVLGDQPPWPAAPERIRAALRILSNLEPRRAAESGASLEGQTATLTIGLDGGAAQSLRLAPRSLGGLALAQADGGEGKPARVAWVDASLADMVAGTGMAPWREERAFADVGPDLARIFLQGGADGTTIELARLQGRWVVRQPVADTADPQAILRLIGKLGAVRIVDFLDAGPPTAGTGLDSPRATLRVESDSRDPADPARSTTTSRTLAAGRESEVGGRNIYARLLYETLSHAPTQAPARAAGDPPLPAPLQAARPLIITGEPLAAITMDPVAYLSPVANPVPASEVGQVRITPSSPSAATPRTFERTLDGWKAGDLPLSPADADFLRSILALLTQARAAAITLDAPSPLPLVTIELATLGGTPLGAASISATEDGSLILQTGRISRRFPPDAAPGLLSRLTP